MMIKQKTQNSPRRKSLNGKNVKQELPEDDTFDTSADNSTSSTASVEIIESLRFQKFRYPDEDRPGNKYQDKDFLTLRLSNLQDRVVRVFIVCTDAENHELIHPNSLIGKSCREGIYDHEYAITKRICTIKIPYIRIHRMKTKKGNYKNIPAILSFRAANLPSPYKERCQSQCLRMTSESYKEFKFDTNKVCLGVIITVDKNIGNLNGTLHAISAVVTSASERTNLGIHKLSSDSVSALTGGRIDIFTTEGSPKIEPDKFQVYVKCDHKVFGINWTSAKYTPTIGDILYQRVITYQIPRFEPDPNLAYPVIASLHLTCPKSKLHCAYTFHYASRKDVNKNHGTLNESKAELTTRVDTPIDIKNTVETIYGDSQDGLQEDEAISFISEKNQRIGCSQEHSILFHQQDSLPEEDDLEDGSRIIISSSSDEAATDVNGENVYMFQSQDKSLPNTSHVYTNFQNLNAVALAFSDADPAKMVVVHDEDGTVIGQMDANSVKPLLFQTVNYNGQGEVLSSPSFGHVEKQENLLTDNDFLRSTIFTRQSAQSSTKIDLQSLCYDSGILTRKDQIKESNSSSEFLEVNNSNCNTVSAGSSVGIMHSLVPACYSPNKPLLNNFSILKRSYSNASPWQVDDGVDSKLECETAFKRCKTH